MEDCVGDEDLISKLPDDILVRILSFLIPQESVRCSTLSRRWIPLPKLVPMSLKFDMKYTEWSHKEFKKLRTIEENKFIREVNKVLDSSQGQTLDEFNICFPLDSRNECQIDKWIQFAMANKVKKFELDFFHFHGLDVDDKIYWFPSMLHRKRLRSRHIGLPRCTSLTALRLNTVNVTGQHIEQFLEYCHFLESVCVIGSDTLISLKVESPAQLKLLDIQHCYFLKNVEISAPNLKSFKCLAHSKKTSVLLKRAPQLNEMFVGNAFYDYLVGNLHLFVGYLSQIETLSLSMDYMDYWGHNVQELDWPMKIPTLSNLKHLTITSNKEGSICLTSWIEASPLLTRFVIKKQWISSLPHSLKLRKAMEPTTGLHQHLKEFEFVGFEGADNDAEFVRYIIDNAVNLDKIVIHCRRTGTWQDDQVSKSMLVAKDCVRNLSSTVDVFLIP